MNARLLLCVAVAIATANIARAQQEDLPPATSVGAATPEAQNQPQRSYSTGFIGGLSVDVATQGARPVSSPHAIAGGGFGSDLLLGYGFSPKWALYDDVSDVAIVSGGGNHVATEDLGARMHFRTNGTNSVTPFLQFGVSVGASVGGWFAGGGFNAYFANKSAVSAALTYASEQEEVRLQVGVICDIDWFLVW